jgi:2,3-bisphosphoglycerate-independent phosphoglycerate mutase
MLGGVAAPDVFSRSVAWAIRRYRSCASAMATGRSTNSKLIGDEEPCDGERRVLVPSARDVPTYDYKPEMSAPQIAAAFVDAWRADSPAFGVINFANADMVGHTGVIDAAKHGIQTVDRCLGQVIEAVQSSGGVCLITADHGNAEHMLEDDGSPNTAHSTNPVPLIVTKPGLTLREQGVLGDVAPTVLELMAIEQPTAMTGTSLMEGAREETVK